MSVSDELVGADGRCEHSATFAAALATVDAMASKAPRLESDGVTRSDVDRLAAVFLDSHRGWSAPQLRELHERLAAASGTLWFVVTQHRSPADAAASTSNTGLRDRYEPGLTSGSLLGAVSFAHLRRARTTVSAARIDGGWEFSGRLDWITSWGLADVLLLMAESDSGQVVQAVLPASERAGLTITGPLQLAAMTGTSTVGAVLDYLTVDDSEVAAVVPKKDWLDIDRQRTANAPPAVIGLARAAVNSILTLATERKWPEALDAARRRRDELLAGRARAYELLDDVDPAECLDERLALRGSLTKLAQETTAMAVMVHGGRAMLTSSPEQRWAREAMFALVQAQTVATRNAVLDAYG